MAILYMWLKFGDNQMNTSFKFA